MVVKKSESSSAEDCGLCEKTENLVQDMFKMAKSLRATQNNGATDQTTPVATATGAAAAATVEVAARGPSPGAEEIKDCMFCRISGCLTGWSSYIRVSVNVFTSSSSSSVVAKDT